MKSKAGKFFQFLKEQEGNVDIALLERAFAFAQEAHGEQQRKSGEAFLSHPLEVAKICSTLTLDTPTLAAALLHDVVEDTNVGIEAVRKDFGEEIASLVDGVTRLEIVQLRDESQAENLRKVVLAMAADVRVIFIKLADRLHNMRTIEHLPPERQKEKARETLEIYAPLAHRLGISSIKVELEDLAFKVLEPKRYELVVKLVAETKSQREKFIEEARNTLAEELEKIGIKAKTEGRLKHLYSIYKKMKEKGKEFSEIYDLSAIRVIVDSLKDCYAALGVVHSLWKPIPGRFKDYIAMPKFNMYQSLHTSVMGPEGKPLEVQIRTQEMHEIAEFGIAAHWRYKEKIRTADEFEKRLSWLRQVFELGSELKDPREFLRSLKLDLLPEEVYVFTPRGDVVSLPQGSTPLDFAYQIHTEVGHSCVGAKVNKRIVPLDYQLQTGDVVEILSSKSSLGPSRDWLKIAKTSRARSKIRQWFSREEREDHTQVGKEALQKVLKKQGLLNTVSFESAEFESLAKSFNYKKIGDFLAGIGSGQISPKQVVTRLIQYRSKQAAEQVVSAAVKKVKVRGVTESGIIVKGVSDVLVRLASCCNPVPGDEIIGYVTRGRGVTVHRSSCPNLRDLMKDEQRLIEVSWSRKLKGPFKTEIRVQALDRTHLLRDVSTVLSDSGVNILSATVTTTKDGLAILDFIFELGNLELLKTILANVRRVDSVFDVQRV